jgi:hypothetical protein
LLSPTGQTVWDLGLPDHADGIALLSLRGPPLFYISAGEEGLLAVDPRSGKVLTQRRWGHVQRYAVGRFDPARAGRQLLTTTLWREPGIGVLYDDRLEVIARWVEMCRDLHSLPLPWGKQGNDLLVNRTRIVDPMTGRLVRPLPSPCGQPRRIAVLDLPAYGPGCLLTITETQWQIWGPGANVPPIVPRYRPNALNPTSYLPALAL